MEVLELDGKRYVKASKAARAAGYTSDYVGQLCRAGKIGAHLVGRSWYVDIDELKSHKTTTKRTSRVKAREQVRRTLEERKNTEATQNGKHFTERIPERHVRFDPDESELIPQVRKLRIESENSSEKRARAAQKQQQKEYARQPDYTFENEGDKIITSGTLEVVDASDEFALDSDATHLKATIVDATDKKRSKKEREKREKRKKERSKPAEPQHAPTPTFTERLHAYDEAPSRDHENEIPIENLDISEGADSELATNADAANTVRNTGRHSLVVHITTLTTLTAVVASVLLLEGIWSYEIDTERNTPRFESRYSVDPDTFVAEIRARTPNPFLR